MKKIIITSLMMLAANIVFAQQANWKVNPALSSLSFIATQNGAPVKGSFKKFNADIVFDFNDLKASKVKIAVDIGSLATSYDELTSTLKTPDWFNVAVFPQAVFESSEITKTGDNQYQAKGTLTIRDKAIPVILNFTATQPGVSAANASGYTTIKRTAFGVGQGEWSSTNEVKDDVRIDFVVQATK